MAGNKPAPQANGAENMNEILKIRREKLAELVQNGRNPFEIKNTNRRTHRRKLKITLKNLKENVFPLRDVLCPSAAWVRLRLCMFRILTDRFSFL